MNNPFLSAYDDGDLIIRKKVAVYFWMLVALTGSMALYIGYLFVGRSSLTGDIRYLAISLGLFALSFLLLKTGNYFWSVNTCLMAVLIPLSVIVYFGQTLSELKLYNMAIFHIVALVFAMLVANNNFQLLGLGALSAGILSLFMFNRLLPQAAERAGNYWASYVTSLLVIAPITLMGMWIRSLLHNSLNEITHKLEHDSESGLLNKAKLIMDLEARDGSGSPGEVVFYRMLNHDEITLNFGSETGVRALLKLAGMAEEKHRGPVYRINENTIACVSAQTKARDGEISVSMIENSRHSCRIGDTHVHMNLKAAIIETGEGRHAELTINQGLLGLYQAQKNHTQLYVVSPNQEAELLRKLDLINELAAAVNDGKCFLHYQPIVNARGEIRAIEALARWTNKAGAAIGPDTFIPLLESSGLMNQFFEGIVETLLADRELWRETRPDLEVYVNLSAVMFEQGYDFLALADRLEGSGVDLGTVGFEITESAVLREEGSNILETLSELSARGVRLAMDDFGTGYTNFSRFLNFPFSKIKFDKSLLKNVETDARNRRLLEILVPYFNSQDIQTICEGIETATQFELLKSFGCAYFQGYLFSRPKPAEEILPLLKSGRILPFPRA